MRAIPVLAIAALLLTGCGVSTAAPGGQPVQSQPYSTSPAPTPPPSPTAHKVGEVVTVSSDESTSKVTIVSAAYSTEPLSRFDTGPRKGGYLTLDVLWETTEGTAEVNPLLFNAKDASGLQQGPQLGMTGVDGLAAASVPAGDRLRGKVVVDIGAGPWTVTMGALTEAARWSIQP